MDSTQTFIVAIISAGGGVVVLEIVKGFIKVLNGAAGRERVRNTSMKDQRDEALAMVRAERKRADDADKLADVEAYNRRRTEEYASRLRRDLIEHNVPEAALPPWPTLRKPPQEQEPS